jgi:predicted secreted protein
MSDVIDLGMEKIKRDPETLRLKLFSDSIDIMVTNAVKDGSDPVAVAAILLNRFKAAAEAASREKGMDVTAMLKRTFL